jgi:hypothetical protein
MHYQRLLRYGGTGPVVMIGKWATLQDRFLNGVQPAGPMPHPELGRCHVWTGSLTRDGYGKLCAGGRTFYAHRLAWRIAYGVWPQRLRQLCGNRRCVRIEHLTELSAAGSA